MENGHSITSGAPCMWHTTTFIENICLSIKMLQWQLNIFITYLIRFRDPISIKLWHSNRVNSIVSVVFIFIVMLLNYLIAIVACIVTRSSISIINGKSMDDGSQISILITGPSTIKLILTWRRVSMAPSTASLYSLSLYIKGPKILYIMYAHKKIIMIMT